MLRMASGCAMAPVSRTTGREEEEAVLSVVEGVM